MVAWTALAACAAPAWAQLFGPGDTILAIDLDEGHLRSDYPDGEAPFQAFDQILETKYLNFAQAGSGVIVTPEFGASVVKSMQMATANDAVPRDPATWELYGTNDSIEDGDNSAGDGENWTLIAAGEANLPDERLTYGPVYNFTNSASYTSYKIVFPDVKDECLANSMQIAEIQLYTGPDATGDGVCGLLDVALAPGYLAPDSRYPCMENPGNALDADPATKYLNFGKENSGFIVERADGAAVTVEQFTITTANDSSSRDPTTWDLYGTNDPVTSADNSTGEEENWTFIDGGTIDLPLERLTAGPTVEVDNDDAYSAYRMVFTTIRDTAAPDADSMQIGGILFEGQGGGADCVADTNNDGALDFFDVQLFLNWFSSHNPNGDINHDTVFDFFDVQAYLNLFSAGCP
jgi:hypothetical protein